jgi:hypothetical protein
MGPAYQADVQRVPGSCVGFARIRGCRNLASSSMRKVRCAATSPSLNSPMPAKWRNATRERTRNEGDGATSTGSIQHVVLALDFVVDERLLAERELLRVALAKGLATTREVVIRGEAVQALDGVAHGNQALI